MQKAIGILSIMCLLICLLGISASAASEGVVVSVVGGSESVSDAIIEQQVDLVGAAKVLGVKLSAGAKSVRVVEVGKTGNLPCQVDLSDGGKYVVCWQVPGELAPGKTRKFRIVLSGQGETPAPKTPISARQVGDDVIVSSGNLTLTYSKGTGGLPRTVRVGSASTSFVWGDKIYNGTEYNLARHSAEKMRLVASGPLRVVYEAQSDYRDSAGKAPDSKPRATYRFTQYAGEQVVRLDARVAQDYAYDWQSVHVVEIQFDGSFAKNYITDKSSGVFKQAGDSIQGNKWAAVHGTDLLVGVLSPTVLVYDGGGKLYPAYVRGSVDPMTKNEFSTRCNLYFGGGAAEIAKLNTWPAAPGSGPTAKVSLGILDRTAKSLGDDLAKERKTLGTLKNQDWVAAHARLTLAGGRLQAGVDSLSSGNFAEAALSLKSAKMLNTSGKSKIESVSLRGITQGVVDGHPYVENNLAIYMFGTAADGYGLISVYDKVNGREYLASGSGSAPLWQVKVKQGGSISTITNRSPAGCSWQQVGSVLQLTWAGTITTRVSLFLPSDSPRLRMQINVTAPSGTGIQTVTFPDVAGIRPISPGGVRDNVLYTWAIGDLKSSPLVTGSALRQDYPYCMQFTGFYSGGSGLYAAEEDPAANQKSFSWTPVSQSGTLSYSVDHPVLGWAGSTLVASYSSPGDVVFGPFAGDWYDACQIYRAWALTAPWCAKGPIYTRADYPRWLSDATNWTIGGTGDESHIENEMTKKNYYETPSMVCHDYGYYFTQTQDNRYPNVLPTKLGSAGTAAAIGQLHANGIKVVPYISGWLWDEDDEGYRAENAATQAALITQDGTPMVQNFNGQHLGCMCPGTTAWVNKLVNVSKELVSRYNFDGMYYDFLTIHTTDCYSTTHGHAIGGGNYWTSSVRNLYGAIRTELKKIRPDVMMTGEDNAEYVIDLLDTELSLGKGHSDAPLFNAVYHGYTLLFGGGGNSSGSGPLYQGRWWLTGNQLGWTGMEDAYPFTPSLQQDGAYYKRLLRCQNLYAKPYLAYGTMLRPPAITGSIPTISGQSSYEPFTFPIIDGTAWKALDGSVGIFFLNYGENSQPFGWSANLAEYAGWGSGTQVRISRWNEADNTMTTIATVPGGMLTRQETLEGRGIMAFKLEVVN